MSHADTIINPQTENEKRYYEYHTNPGVNNLALNILSGGTYHKITDFNVFHQKVND